MIYILIPSYNDAENFHRLFASITKSLKKIKYKIIVVDDGSTDDTIKVIKKLSKKFPAERIGYKQNTGPGYAFKFGFKYLVHKLKKDDIVITMEADNTTDYTILNKMIEKSRNFSIVLASVFTKGGSLRGMEKQRIVLSFIASMMDRALFRIKGVKTYSSFYRVYRASILKKAMIVYKNKLITDNGFSSVIEILAKLNKIGATFGEVPATLDWKYKKGNSKMKIGKTIWRHFNLYKNYLLGEFKK